MAREQRILVKRHRSPSDIVSPSDFVVFGGRDVRLATLLREVPGSISPYAIDFAREEVVFVLTTPGVDLAKAHPFFYEAQRIHATAVVRASFDEAHDAAVELEIPRHRFSFLYSPGRCGSTVAGKVAGRLPGVQSLSEPDFYSQVAHERDPADRRKERGLVRVVAALSRLLAHHRLAIEPSRTTILVKHRGAALYAAETIRDAVPRSRALFLHRNGADVVDSYVGAFLRNPLVSLGRALGLDRLVVRVLRVVWPRLVPSVARFMPLVIEPGMPDRDSHGVVEVLAIGFHSMMQEASRLERSGSLRFESFLRYEDLREDPTRFVKSLASGLGVAIEDESVVTTALAAVRSNAQEGSKVASDGTRSLSENDVVRVERMLARVSGRLQPAGGVS